MSDLPSDDDEIIIRHIPKGRKYQGDEPYEITPANFELRVDKGETGISCAIKRIMSARKLLARFNTTPKSKVGAAKISEIRALGFKVTQSPGDFEGHVEIESGEQAKLESLADRLLLAELFHFISIEEAEHVSEDTQWNEPGT